MKDIPITAAASAAGVSLVAGTVLGLPLAGLIAGFGGGLVALSFMPPLATIVARMGSVATGTITAGFLGPYTAAVAHVDGVAASLELYAFSFVWGAGVQILLPAAINALRRRIDQAGGGSGNSGDKL